MVPVIAPSSPYHGNRAQVNETLDAGGERRLGQLSRAVHGDLENLLTLPPRRSDRAVDDRVAARHELP